MTFLWSTATTVGTRPAAPRPVRRTRPEPAPWRHPTGGGDARLSPLRPLLRLLVPVGAVAAWLGALAATDITRVGALGLLGVVHPAYFAAVALCVTGFLLELRRRDVSPWALAGYLGLLIAIVHATTPLLLETPQYAWTYKHLGVVELFGAEGRVTGARDIYQQWPASFAAVAELVGVSGIDPAALARWAPVFFNLAGSLVLLAIGRSLSTDRRLPFLAVFLFQAVNWIEEDYLSPQAFAFLLHLCALLLVLRFLATRPGPSGGGRFWHRAADRLRQGLPAARPTSRAERGWALAALAVVFAVLTATHQLTPFLLLASLAGLTLLRLVRPRWLVLLLGGLLVGYLIPRIGFVTEAFGVFDGFNIFSNAGGNARGWGSAGQMFSAIAVRTLALTVWGLAAYAVLRHRRRPGVVLVPALLAAAPFLLLFAQSYGGEAIYRVFLFSAPWCAWLIAGLFVRPTIPAPARPDPPPAPARHRARRVPRRPAALFALAALALSTAVLGTVQGRHGQLPVDRQTPATVEASRYLYAHAEPGATIATATPNFPGRIAGNYPLFNTTLPTGEPELVRGAELAGRELGPAQVPAIEQYLRSFGGTTAYLVIGDGDRRYAEYFGALPDGSLDRLVTALDDSPQWSVFYRNREVTVFRLGG